MKNFKLIIPVILGISLLLYISCRRDPELRRERISPEQKFFSVPGNTDPIVKEIAKKIFKQNQQYGFVNSLIGRVGYPVWNKSNFQKSLHGNHDAGRTAHVSRDYVYIPFVSDKGLSSILIVGMATADTSYRLLYPEEYSAFDFNYTDTTKTNARDVFLLFARFENLVSGHEEFEIKDNRLFGFNGLPPTRAAIRFTNGSGCENCSAYQMPEFWEICVTYSGPNCNCPSSYEVCDMCPTCDEEQCWSGWTIGGGDGGGDGWDDGDAWEGEGGGGGGGDNNGWWEEPCDEDANGDGRVEPCDNIMGWEPIEEDPGLPYSQWGYKHFESWYVSQEDYVKIENWRLSNIDTIGIDSCRRLILRKLLGSVSGNNAFGKILAKMDRSIFEANNIEKFTWKLNFSSLGPGTVAQLDSFSYNPSNGLFTAITLIDSLKIRAATDIYVAGTFLHEAIHAYMMSVLYRVKNGVTIAQLQAMSYDSVFNEYIDTLTARNVTTLNAQSFPGAYHHNFMQRKLLDAMAEALKEFDNNRINDDEYYWYIAWKGLFETDPWRQHWPNYPNTPIIGAPITTEDSTRGMTYALTPTRLSLINSSIGHERQSDSLARGLKPVNGGCY